MGDEKRATRCLNVEIPAEVHRRAKAAAAMAEKNWDEAVAEALDQWARKQGVAR